MGNQFNRLHVLGEGKLLRDNLGQVNIGEANLSQLLSSMFLNIMDTTRVCSETSLDSQSHRKLVDSIVMSMQLAKYQLLFHENDQMDDDLEEKMTWRGWKN